MTDQASLGRTTLDFFGAQANARRRTTALVLSFGLALAVVVTVVYVALLIVLEMWSPRPEAWTLATSDLELLQPWLLIGAAAGVAAITGLGTAYHALRLSAGGGDAIAEMLGGVPVQRGTENPDERRLVNVVEEMAIASGVPVPRLYVLERETSINAFAAGYTPGHSVVAVTRGALDRLTRDELQGVVAHELSHILNADTRIDLRLLAAVGGLTVLSLIGRVLLDGSPRSSRSRDGDRRGSGGLLVLGLALLAAGAFGALCGKLVRYAVARQREWLADACAVQFTRNPDGLAGALRKIAQEGSRIASPHAPEAAHLFFASSATGFFSDLLSTHPPIEERIRRISAHLDVGGGARAPRPAAAGSQPGAAVPPPAAVVPAAPIAGVAAASGGAPPARITSRPAPEHIVHAAGVLERLPPELVSAARDPATAQAIACALLVDEAPEVRARQHELLAHDDRALLADVARLMPAIAKTRRADRLALLGLAIPALDALSQDQRTALEAHLRALSDAREGVTPFDLAVRRSVTRRLTRGRGAPPRARLRSVDDAGPECLELLSLLAWLGARDEAAAQAALDAGVRVLGARAPWRLLPRDRLALGRLDVTLTTLDEAVPALKACLLDACVATVLADAQVTIEEAELVRAVSASLGLAMPPVVPNAERGRQLDGEPEASVDHAR